MTDTTVQLEEATTVPEETPATVSVTKPTKARRGFALLSPERRAEIASKGGKQSQANGTAHKFTSDEARAAGKKGGAAFHTRRGRQPMAKVTTEEVTTVVSDTPNVIN